MLIRLVYASTATKPVNREVLDAILKTARLRNEVRDLTGLLVFDHQYFLQVIEGHRSAVSLLLSKLFADSRHSELTVLEFDEISQRMFADGRNSQPATAAAPRGKQSFRPLQLYQSRGAGLFVGNAGRRGH
jgi:predicted outer membrane protein